MPENLKEYTRKLEIFNIEQLLGDGYKIVNSIGNNYEIHHDVCKRTETRSIYSIRDSVNPGCRYCLAIEKERTNIKRFLNDEYQCLDKTPGNYGIKFLVQHSLCQRLFLKSHNEIKNKFFHCRKCKSDFKNISRKTKLECIKIAKEKNGKCLDIWIEDYIRQGSSIIPDIHVTWKCEYGYVWNESLINVRDNSIWCSHCKQGRLSIELKVEKVLQNLGYQLQELIIKENLVINPETGHFLKVDFRIKNKNIVIHCIKKQDVIQNKFNSVEDSKKRNEFRRRFCDFNHIKYIEIDYNFKEPEIKQILIKEIGYIKEESEKYFEKEETNKNFEMI